MKFHAKYFTSMVVAMVLSYGPIASAVDEPQASVECTGWHAVCALANDCKLNQDRADCACWKVNEPHIVVTTNIKDETFGGAPIRLLTITTCTTAHPCGVDEAPVCAAIKNLNDGQWVSTFSYRGWCNHWDAVSCDGNKAGQWADCMTSACTEVQNRPQRPLNCECTVHDGPFVGTRGHCKSRKGRVMSTIPLQSWDFDNDTFAFDLPGDGYVNSACTRLKSDRE